MLFLPLLALGANAACYKPASPCEGGSTLTIPAGPKEICPFAFSGCTAYTNQLVLPDSLVNIGNHAFAGCTELTGDLVIPDSVVVIGELAFVTCSKLTGKLVLPKSLTTIGEQAFLHTGFTGPLVLPYGLKEIRKAAFVNNRGLTGALYVPKSVTLIDSHAFAGAANLEYVILGGSNTKVVSGAFGRTDQQSTMSLKCWAGTLGPGSSDPRSIWEPFNLTKCDGCPMDVYTEEEDGTCVEPESTGSGSGRAEASLVALSVVSALNLL